MVIRWLINDSKSCIPTNSAKSGDDNYFSLVHNIRTGVHVDSNKTNPTYLVG